MSKFRRGQTDDALRQSIPVGTDPGRGGGMYHSDRLPTNNLGWSFASLFGPGGGRGASLWAGGRPDTWRDLIAEYRRAAQQAADRGDFRRAALIYAKLLGDYRAAAEVLARGGLHREAGILFRDKVRHPDRAAREFEQAGEHDEALRLYREVRLFVDAGDLLRRLGEEEQAVAEYHKAAELAVELRHDFVEAGDLMLKKTGRADLAIGYLARGWDARATALATARNATACACRLIELYALAEDREPFWILLTEAEDWLKEPGWSADAGKFFNAVVECAELPHLRADRGELRDRARLGLALKLQQHARAEATAGTAVADQFGSPGRWSPAVVSDADFALRAALKVRPKGTRPGGRATALIRLRESEVTAAVQSAHGGDLFVGFRDGSIVWFDPSANESRIVYDQRVETIHGLATDDAGEWLVALRADSGPHVPQGGYVVEKRTRSRNRFRLHSRLHVAAGLESVTGLLPAVVGSGANLSVGVSTLNGVVWYVLQGLLPPADAGPSGPLPPAVHLKLRVPDTADGHPFTFQGGSVSWGGPGWKAFIGWMPEPAPGGDAARPAAGLAGGLAGPRRAGRAVRPRHPVLDRGRAAPGPAGHADGPVRGPRRVPRGGDLAAGPGGRGDEHEPGAVAAGPRQPVRGVGPAGGAERPGASGRLLPEPPGERGAGAAGGRRPGSRPGTGAVATAGARSGSEGGGRPEGRT